VNKRAIEKNSKLRINAERVVRLARLLDKQNACLLVKYFAYTPDEIGRELSAMENALERGSEDVIFDLLSWYDLRKDYRVAGVKFNGQKIKRKLAIENYRPKKSRSRR